MSTALHPPARFLGPLPVVPNARRIYGDLRAFVIPHAGKAAHRLSPPPYHHPLCARAFTSLYFYTYSSRNKVDLSHYYYKKIVHLKKLQDLLSQGLFKELSLHSAFESGH